MVKPSAQSHYKVEVFTTADESHSLRIPALDELYHSKHSAIKEARHVYVEAGLFHCLAHATPGALRVFEMGFGTGLNALMCALASQEVAQKVHYTSIEKYPVGQEVWSQLNFTQAFEAPGEGQQWFAQLHGATWQQEVALHEYFTLYKLNDDFLTWASPKAQFHLILWDAFGFRAQEELWSEAVFEKCFDMLKPGGVLVTYASKGLVRRNMLKAGFRVEKLQGPPGKREMVRASKPKEI